MLEYVDRWIVAGLLVVGGLVACDASPGGRVAEPRPSATVAVQLRTERAPISDRFPALGEFVEARWIGGTQGNAADSSRVSAPGPTDYWLEATVRLLATDFAAARGKYRWEPQPAGFVPPSRPELTPELPAPAQWSRSDDFDRALFHAGLTGTSYLDQRSGTVYLRVTTS